jgi:hypothetical protein
MDTSVQGRFSRLKIMGIGELLWEQERTYRSHEISRDYLASHKLQPSKKKKRKEKKRKENLQHRVN